ncbi:MAG: ATP-binding protein, partial [Clostridia bacterium]
TLQLQPTRQSKLFESLYSMMQRFCNKFDTIPLQCILLMGEVGIGKSSLATATANELMNKGKIVLYFTAFEINNIFLKHHIANANIDDLTFESIFDCDFLIIDDLGTEPLYNNISLQYFFSIVDSRILNKKKTMICTNLSIDKFVQRYGERAFSRLTDKRYALPLDYIVGDDLRKIKK